MARHNGYRTVHESNPQLVQVHPCSAHLALDEDGLFPEWILYHELVNTSRPFVRSVSVPGERRTGLLPILLYFLLLPSLPLLPSLLSLDPCFLICLCCPLCYLYHLCLSPLPLPPTDTFVRPFVIPVPSLPASLRSVRLSSSGWSRCCHASGR